MRVPFARNSSGVNVAGRRSKQRAKADDDLQNASFTSVEPSVVSSSASFNSGQPQFLTTPGITNMIRVGSIVRDEDATQKKVLQEAHPEMHQFEEVPLTKKKRSFKEIFRVRSRSFNRKKKTDASSYDDESQLSFNPEFPELPPKDESTSTTTTTTRSFAPSFWPAVQIMVNPGSEVVPKYEVDPAFKIQARATKKLAPAKPLVADETTTMEKGVPKNRYSVPNSNSYDSSMEDKLHRGWGNAARSKSPTELDKKSRSESSWIPNERERYAIANAFIFGEEEDDLSIDTGISTGISSTYTGASTYTGTSAYTDVTESTTYTGASVGTKATGLSVTSAASVDTADTGAYTVVTEDTGVTTKTGASNDTDDTESTNVTGGTSMFDLALSEDVTEDEPPRTFTRSPTKSPKRRLRKKPRQRPGIFEEILSDVRLLAEDIVGENNSCVRIMCAGAS